MLTVEEFESKTFVSIQTASPNVAYLSNIPLNTRETYSALLIIEKLSFDVWIVLKNLKYKPIFFHYYSNSELLVSEINRSYDIQDVYIVKNLPKLSVVNWKKEGF